MVDLLCHASVTPQNLQNNFTKLLIFHGTPVDSILQLVTIAIETKEVLAAKKFTTLSLQNVSISHCNHCLIRMSYYPRGLRRGGELMGCQNIPSAAKV